MKPTQPTDFTQVYIDKFLFIEAKKYLSLKGPLGLDVVHDSMYPLLKFGMPLIVTKAQVRKGQLACFWKDDILHPCLISEVFSDQSFKAKFLNKDEVLGPIDQKYFLGEIIQPKISIWWRLKLWRLTR